MSLDEHSTKDTFCIHITPHLLLFSVERISLAFSSVISSLLVYIFMFFESSEMHILQPQQR